MFVKLKKFKFVVGVIYNPPSNCNNSFVNAFSEILEFLLLGDMHDYVILGDMNVDLLNNSSIVNNFQSVLRMHDCKQHLTDPTRVTEGTESLIDIIVSNIDFPILNSEVSDVCLADHNLISCEINAHVTVKSNYTRVVRSYKNFNVDSFNCDLLDINWREFYSLIDVQDKADYFYNCLLNLFDKHAPLQEVTFNTNGRCQPWFTETLRKFSNLKRNAWQRYKRTGNAAHKAYFCSLRKVYNDMLISERRGYLRSRVNGVSPSEMWKNLKSLNILPRKNQVSSLPSEFCNPTEINDYFLDTVPVLTANWEYLDRLETRSGESFEYIPAGEEHFMRAIHRQRFSSASADGVSGRMLCLSTPHILRPIVHLLNFSMEVGVLPDQWKTSFVSPLEKKRPISSLADLRPICKQPVLLKVAEGILLTQLGCFVDDNDILPMFQSGFRKSYSTTSALCTILDDVLDARDKSEMTCLVLLDMSRAFDSLNLECLLAKLGCCGIAGNTLAWLGNYLVGRHQITRTYVDGVEAYSNRREVYSGVPQGSILGPLLFSLYTSDLQNVLKHCRMHMYADDLQIYLRFGQSCGIAEHLVGEDLKAVESWARSNCLVLNPEKTQCMIFGTRQLLSHVPDFGIMVNGKLIQSCKKVKNLGVIIDCNLKFGDHVNLMCKRAFYSLKQISHLKNFLDIETKKMLVETLVLCHFNYADVVYGPCLTNDFKYKIQRAQNCCIRYIVHVPYRSHVTPFIRDLGWLRMNERRFLHYVCFVLNVVRNQAPAYLFSKLSWRVDIHDVNLRNIAGKITVPQHSTSAFRASFSYLAAYVLNNLPPSLIDVSLETIKRTVKRDIADFQSVDFNMF